MPFQVVLVRENERTAVRWPGEGAAGPQAGEALRPWRDLCLELVSQGLAGKPRIEIFLCLLADQLLDGEGRERLQRLARLACESAWGSDVYVARTANPDIFRPPAASIESMRSWIHTALKEQVRDVVQVRYDPWDAHSIDAGMLRDAVERRSRPRQVAARRSGSGPWRCTIHRKGGLSALLEAQASPAPPRRPSALVVGDNDVETLALLEIASGDRTVEQLIAGTLRMAPRRQLEARCCSSGFGAPLWFAGDLELSYFFARLNERHRVAADRGGPSGEVVVVDPKPTFELGGPEPRVLFTSSFNPDAQPDECVAVAKDIGDLLATTLCGARCFVDPAVTPEKLLGDLTSLGDVDIWVHMGHGLGEKGLKAADGSEGDPSRWLSCFAGRRRLALALFLCCDSHQTAAAFARGGARVAVGFEGEVFSPHCRHVNLTVLNAAVETPGDTRGILKAIEVAGRQSLAFGPAVARAFLPDR